MPMLPFVALAGGLVWLSRQETPLSKQETIDAARAPGGPEAAAPPPSPQEDLEASLPLDLMALEVGYELVPTVDPKMGGTLVDRIASLRRQIALDLGVVIPPIHIRDNLAIPAGGYRVLLLGAEIASGTTHAGRLLAMDATGTAAPIDGDETIEPAFGTPARWIMARDRELAEVLGWTVVDHTTMIATHLAETARRHAHELLGRGELAHLFEVFSRTTPKLVEDLVPNLLSLGEVLKVLRNLLKEGVSIRDLRSVLEALVELAPATRDPEQLTEMVRQRVARQISSQFSDNEKAIWTLVLDTKVEDVFRRSLREIATGTGGALDPEAAKQIGVALETGAQRMLAKGKQPVVLTAPDIRRYVRALAERRCPNLAVLSFREIEPDATLKPFEVVALSGA
jgi:flagellar biosynthesis protein FlhA